MATIEKMMICGLRSFGPHEEHMQTVKFASPLTLILGENGCGKTTIIEALKFACSGDLPGGTKSGQGFVNDPKLSGASSTKGQVRLKFGDAKGNKYVVVKCVQVVNKGTTSSFKRLDTTLKCINPNAVERTVSSRCVDVDGEICGILGVSKAILNNVIFCHQEDSAWPLDEPKKLKEKFDEIFGATEYNKCVETIRKTMREKHVTNKVLQANVGSLKQTKDIVDKKRADMQEKDEKVSSFENVIQEKQQRLIPITARIQEICDLETNLGKLQQQLAMKKTEQDGIVQQQNEILANLNTVEFVGSDQELENEIASFETNRARTERKLEVLQEKKKSVEGKKAEVTTSVGRLQVKVGKLQGEKVQNERTIRERNELMRKTANNFKGDVTLSMLESNENVITAIDAISAIIASSKANLENTTQKFDAEEIELQKQIDEARNKLAKANHGIEGKNQQINELKGKNREINSQLRELDYSDEQLKKLESKITQIDGDLKLLKSSFDPDVVTKSIDDDKTKMRQYEESLETLERDYKVLQKNAITEAEIENQTHEVAKRKSEMSKLENTHYEIFQTIFGDDVPTAGFLKKAIETQKQINSKKIEDITKRVSLKQKETTTLETKFKVQKQTVRSLEKELESSERQVLELTHGKQFDVLSNEVHQAIEKLQKDKGQYSAGKLMFEKFLKEFQSAKPCCPVCQTDFSSKQAAATAVASTIVTKIQGIPQKLAEVEEELRRKQEQYNKLLQLKPASDKISNLNTVLIPNARTEMNNFDSFYKRVSNELQELTDQLSIPQTIVNACNKVIGDAALLDQHQFEVSRSQRRIMELEAQIVQVSSNRSRQQTEAELENVKTDLSNIRRNCEMSQKKLLQHNVRCQELREERSKHVEKQLSLQKAMQGKPQLQEQLLEISQKEQTLKTEITELQMQLNPLKAELKHAETSKDALKVKNRTELSELARNLNRDQKALDDINKLQMNVQAYIARGGDGVLKTALEELAGFKENIDRLDANLGEIATEITNIEKQLHSQEGVFRALKDNASLRTKRLQEQKVVEQMVVLKNQIGNYDYRTVLVEKRRLSQLEDEIQREINMNVGRNDELKLEITKIRSELNTPEYKQAYTRYKEAYIKYICAKKMVENLELYIKALEFGIMEFHKERMLQINKIISKLWRSIYRGNDCDYIAIKTDETKTSGLKRSYTYKVIQMKGDVELDMRGRCSAGQKVLACLVIRMALAETFSKNCGILALDEPTTNLDRTNIVSLSNALARIVNNRQQEKNFQLLIITHDEEFLSTLTRIDKVSYFWRVSRDDRGNSVVTREML